MLIICLLKSSLTTRRPTPRRLFKISEYNVLKLRNVFWSWARKQSHECAESQKRKRRRAENEKSEKVVDDETRAEVHTKKAVNSWNIEQQNWKTETQKPGEALLAKLEHQNWVKCDNTVARGAQSHSGRKTAEVLCSVPNSVPGTWKTCVVIINNSSDVKR